MLQVTPLVEGLRARPHFVFWSAALAQAVIWTLVPALFYASPPGDMPQVLAIGREWQAGSVAGPPLASWLAEIAFNLSGRHVIGVYLLSQLCVVVTYWAVFTLGCSIVGVRHAAMAVLLMAGIFIFSVHSAEFGPAVAGMPFAALAMLHLWRAFGEGKARYWFAAGADLGLLILASYAGLVLLAVIALFLSATPRGRAALSNAEPWAGGMLAVFIASPYLIWLANGGRLSPGGFLDAMSWSAATFADDWLMLIAGLLLAHAGLAVFILIAVSARKALGPAPSFAREPVGDFARTFVYYFAVAPAAAGLIIAVLAGGMTLAGGTGPLVVLSTLGIVVAAGDLIELRRQRALSLMWIMFLIGPALAMAGGVFLLPWTLGVALNTNDPAASMARFFTESFNRRTGRPLELVIGDQRLVSLVALASRDRPSIFIDGSPERSPWVGETEVRDKGGIVLWPVTDAVGAPPPIIRARFPNLTPEMPRAFERPVQGRLPLMRVGWALIRPQSKETGQTTGRRPSDSNSGLGLRPSLR